MVKQILLALLLPGILISNTISPIKSTKLPNQRPSAYTTIEQIKQKGVSDLKIYSPKSQTVTTSEIQHCAQIINQTLEILPKTYYRDLKSLTLSFDPNARRGLGGKNTIIIRCANITEPEFVSVFLHELGHVFDASSLTGTPESGTSNFMDGNTSVYQDDLSKYFYNLSFSDEKNLQPNSKPIDFVSEYASTDPFEDFAESFNMYLLHGEKFRQMTDQSKILKQKYTFLKKHIFNNKEFSFDQKLSSIPTKRTYDSTILPFDYNLFLTHKFKDFENNIASF